MENPTKIIKHSINKTLKFKKTDLQALQVNERVNTPKERLVFNSYYYFFISPYTLQNNNEKFGIAIYVSDETATSTEVDVEYSIKSAKFSTKVNQKFTKGKSITILINKSCIVFDLNRNYFIGDELIIDVKATFTMTFSPRTKYPFVANWIIKRSDLERSKTSSHGVLQSKRFSVATNSDMKYFVKMYTNGYYRQGIADLYFNLDLGNSQKVEAFVSLSIPSMRHYHNFTYVFESSHGRGGDMCSTADLFDPTKFYFIDDKMEVLVKGYLMIEKKIEPMALKLENGFATKAYMKYRGKEFTFFIGDKTIKVHKKVLMEASPVFAGMLESGLTETIEKKMDLIDFEYVIVDAAIKLLYSYPIPTKFTLEQVLDILRFADKYQIQRITDTVEDYLIERISQTNVCFITNYTSSKAHAPKLYSKCMKYLKNSMRYGIAVADLETLGKESMLKILTELSTHYPETVVA